MCPLCPTTSDHSGPDKLQVPLMQRMAEHLPCHLPTLSIDTTFANEDGIHITVTTEKVTIE